MRRRDKAIRHTAPFIELLSYIETRFILVSDINQCS